jgi:hypothetical protein
MLLMPIGGISRDPAIALRMHLMLDLGRPRPPRLLMPMGGILRRE